jgi:hypothetical protein
MLLLLGLVMTGGCGREAPTGRDDAGLNKQRGAQIVAEYLKRDASPYRRQRVRLTITSASEPLKVYELEISRKQTQAETATLTHVVQPADESDLAALSVERKGEPAVNITFVSSTGQFRETGTNKMFFGGLTAQELLGEWEKYDYSLLAEKDLNGVKVYEVEGTLRPPSDSTIAKTRNLFRADTYLPAEMHLMDSDGKDLRTFRVTKYNKVSDRDVVWLTEIENHSRPTRVVIETLSIDWPDKVDEAIFTRERVKEIALRR